MSCVGEADIRRMPGSHKRTNFMQTQRFFVGTIAPEPSFPVECLENLYTAPKNWACSNFFENALLVNQCITKHSAYILKDCASSMPIGTCLCSLILPFCATKRLKDVVDTAARIERSTVHCFGQTPACWVDKKCISAWRFKQTCVQGIHHCCLSLIVEQQ